MRRKTGTISATKAGKFRLRATGPDGVRRTIGHFSTREEAEAIRSEVCSRGASFKPTRLDGGVYFFQAGQDGHVKIGYADGVRRRLLSVQACNPAEVRCIGLLRGADRSVERTLHLRFARAHIRGEWFHPVKDLMDAIAESVSLDQARRKSLEARTRKDAIVSTDGVN